jgi:hypothetical protein
MFCGVIGTVAGLKTVLKNFSMLGVNNPPAFSSNASLACWSFAFSSLESPVFTDNAANTAPFVGSCAFMFVMRNAWSGVLSNPKIRILSALS